MAKKILVTGAGGEIGTIVREDLAGVYDITPVARRELPEPAALRIDVAEDYDALKRAVAGHDAILHLAYVSAEKPGTTANHAMVKNVCLAAMETQPRPRLVLASSIHAEGNHLYGALKRYIESLGEFYASQGLEVVVIRFGGVRRDDRIPDEPGYGAFYLSRADCAQIISRAIDAELPQNYVCVHAVSDNEGRVHDLSAARELLGHEPE